MEENKGAMEPQQFENSELRSYLLGMLADESRVEKIESSIMTEEEFNEILSMAEDDLIDDYLAGQLNADEQTRFKQHFLVTEDRRERFKFAGKLKKFAVSASRTSRPPTPGKFFWFLSTPAFRFAAILALMCACGFLFWRTFVYQSAIDRGIAELRQAYKGRRPIEPRTALNEAYSPYIVTRGEVETATDPAARDRAQLIISASQSKNDFAARRALGLLLLSKGELEPAIVELEAAKKLEPMKEEVLVVLGAAYFELARSAEREGNGAKRIESLGKASAEFGAALKINPNSRGARFNRALALDAQALPEEAKRAWREYLEVETDPQWIDEANRRLQRLEIEPAKELSADELERRVGDALRIDDKSGAWQAISANRELVKDKFLPQRLAMKIVAEDESKRAEAIARLRFVGEIESEMIGDRFGLEIAEIYSDLSDSDRVRLLRAHQSVRRAYALIQGSSSDYSVAKREFESASKDFRSSGDIPNARLADYLAGYCMINQDQSDEALKVFSDVADFAVRRKFKWLEATTVHWIGGAHVKLGYPTRARDAYDRALAIATEIGDPYAMQRNVAELSKVEYFLGNRDRSLALVDLTLSQMRDQNYSSRQRYRNLSAANYVLERLGMEQISADVAAESVIVADNNQDYIFRVMSRNYAAVGRSQNGDYPVGAALLEEARQIAESIPDDATRDRMTALTALSTAGLARKSGDGVRAEALFDQAIAIYKRLEMPANLYEAQKGRLLTLISRGRRAEAEVFIPDVLKTTEDYRAKILEAQWQTKFIDREQSVYEISAEFRFSNGDIESAYDLLERSNSRALLDWLRVERGFENSRPRNLAEIRAAMPTDSQILQFAVFESKTIAFVVDRERFVAREILIGRLELSALVGDFLKAVLANDLEPEASNRLFERLIAPIRNELSPSKTICIVPNKILFFLPFAALTDTKGTSFGATFDHVYAPGASAFLEFRSRAEQISSGGTGTILAIGNPESASLKNLQNLPSAEGEARDIAVYYGSPTILLGRNATRERFLNSIRNADVVHFAGHYVALPNSPMSSYMVLSSTDADDGIVTNADLMKIDLPQTKLVVLSACRTGVENFYNGEGMAGLARTFLAAGVPQVVASQWPVDSEATAQLMKSFHRFRTRDGLNTAAALRRAQTEMANEPSGRFRNPFFWAGFAVFGATGR